jgi:hypothetical protein
MKCWASVQMSLEWPAYTEIVLARAIKSDKRDLIPSTTSRHATRSFTHIAVSRSRPAARTSPMKTSRTGSDEGSSVRPLISIS